MTREKVYSVTVMDIRDPESQPYWRTIAIFTDVETAIQAVKENAVDMAEHGTNQYAVVEKTFLNQVYPTPADGEGNLDKEIYWFEWNPEEEAYVEAEIPFQYQKVYAFGIG